LVFDFEYFMQGKTLSWLFGKRASRVSDLFQGLIAEIPLVIARAQQEVKTRRFVFITLAAVLWLVLLLILSSRGGHGLFESTHMQAHTPFQLPDTEVAAQPLLAGSLKHDAGFGRFSADYYHRDWFELQLPAVASEAVAPDPIVGLENIRLFSQDGSQLCSIDGRLDAPQRPWHVILDADLDLSQQSVKFPGRKILVHHFEVFWQPRYQSPCPYEKPVWVKADVIRKATVADDKQLWLELAQEEKSIRRGSSSVTSRPGALPGEWLIEVVNLGDQSLHFAPGNYPAHKGWHRARHAYSGLYDGLWDTLIRSEAFLAADLYQLRFDGTPPKRLPIRLLHGKEERLVDVRFSTDAKLRSIPSVPSAWRVSLNTELGIPKDLPAQPSGQEYHELFLPISLSAACQLRIVDSTLPGVVWRAKSRLPVDDFRGYTQLPDSHLDRVRWELQSLKVGQRFFHDGQVQSELSCPTLMVWQALPYKAKNMPWLVSVNALPTGAVQAKQPARQFFGRFRFLDAGGQALMPVSRAADLADPMLESFLFPGDVFKFHGEVVHIEQLVSLDVTPRKERWMYSLMKLEAR
jgi:hypothetical protein